jgi:hypothetical protein
LLKEAWETDATFQTLRQLFMIAGYDDIKKPADHYLQYEKAVQEAGLQKLLIQANKYIQAVEENRHEHKTAQIVWFLYDGWKNDFDKKEKNQLPKAVNGNRRNNQLTKKNTGSLENGSRTTTTTGEPRGHGGKATSDLGEAKRDGRTIQSKERARIKARQVIARFCIA